MLTSSLPARRLAIERIDADVNFADKQQQQRGNVLPASSSIPFSQRRIVFVPKKGQGNGLGQHGDIKPYVNGGAAQHGMKLASPPTSPGHHHVLNGEVMNGNGNHHHNNTLTTTSSNSNAITFSSRGLVNHGATCYLNSVLQGVLHCAPFTMFLLRNLDKEDPDTAKMKDALDVVREHVLTCTTTTALHKQHQHHQRRRVPPLDPIRLLRILKPNQRAAAFRQEDAHEALRLLLESLQRSCLSRLGYSPLLSDARSETTYVHQIFGGVITTVTTCPQCHKHSSKSDSFLDLSLELAKSVPAAIEKHFKDETLTNDNQWRCEACNRLVCATRKPRISKAPLVLVVHLKRFAYTIHGRVKLRDAVHVPLKLTVSSDSGPVAYDLVAQLVHHGRGPNSGHYYSRALSPLDGRTWIEFDDDDVRQVPENVISHEQQAYIVFYVKHGFTQFTANAVSTLKPSSLLPRTEPATATSAKTPAPPPSSVCLNSHTLDDDGDDDEEDEEDGLFQSSRQRNALRLARCFSYLQQAVNPRHAINVFNQMKSIGKLEKTRHILDYLKKRRRSREEEKIIMTTTDNNNNDPTIDVPSSMFSFDMTGDERRDAFFAKRRALAKQTRASYDEWDKALDQGRKRRRRDYEPE